MVTRGHLGYSEELRPEWRNWQTRGTQNPVQATVCGFDPLLRHQFSPSTRLAIIPAMDTMDSGAIGMTVGLSIVVQLAWHVAVIVLVYKIWQKVKHLPE